MIENGIYIQLESDCNTVIQERTNRTFDSKLYFSSLRVQVTTVSVSFRKEQTVHLIPNCILVHFSVQVTTSLLSIQKLRQYVFKTFSPIDINECM